jgi:general secretion pathway protein M
MMLPPKLQARWDALAGRERLLLLLAATVVVAAALWWLALAPALATLRAADAQHRALDAQLQQMQSLQAQATALQAQPKLGFDDAQRTLEALLKQRLGASAQMSVVGDRASVTLKGANADALAQWLTQARINARAVPSEVRLVRSAMAGSGSAAPAGSGSAGAGSGNAAWDGTLVLNLPAR